MKKREKLNTEYQFFLTYITVSFMYYKKCFKHKIISSLSRTRFQKKIAKHCNCNYCLETVFPLLSFFSLVSHVKRKVHLRQKPKQNRERWCCGWRKRENHQQQRQQHRRSRKWLSKYMKITHQSKKVCVAIFQTCAVSLVVLMRHGCCNLNIFYNFNISKECFIPLIALSTRFDCFA